ncbi:hypothetical protein V8D89_005549 [Ganoderma adspersum]
MPHDRPFTTLLHPDQALTAEQAAGWVTDLIDYYSQSVSALYHDTLPEEALPGYTETLRSLLECAGALEQHLCGMCFFLPNQLSRAVVAITVAVYYQSALLDAFIEDPEADACVVIDVETLDNMSLYLQRVSAYIDTLRDWLASERYLMLQGVARKAVSVMRNRIASATGSPGRHDTPPYVPRSPTSRAKSKAAEVPFARLESFLRRLCQDHFLDEPSPSTSSSTVVLPLHPTDAVAGSSRVAGLSSPTATTPSPFHISLPELELTPQEFQSERRPSLTSSDTTCVEESTLGSPSHLETKVCSSPEQTGGSIHSESTPNAREAQTPRQSLKRRRRTTSTFASSSPPSSSLHSNSNSNAESSRPRKRHKHIAFNLRTFGLVGAEDIETYDSVYVGRAVPVQRVPTGYDGAPGPMSLPSRNISISPSASQTSAALRARSLSPLALEGIPPPSPSGHGVPSVWLDAVPHAQSGLGSSMLLEPEWRYGMVEVDARSEGGESDGESFTTADEGLYADVEMEDGDEHDAGASLSREDEVRADIVVKGEDEDGPNARSRASSPPPLPVLSSKAKGKRRCFAGIFRTFRHIFNSGR